ncbi:hypothetical protein K493DRAFT_333417 [Basidiobolus meristosporus CBS 931.73]|uniref:Vesicle transport protein USE1 n=1 Tax=Basidiobolus meristosporus CBS 931.73 TaxID=1314790 RepID=A0A1Y1Z6M8_9FUNG|nr:hypothetical protein K493DRAFT_333417 [Basidiobolus meristosporus CBS 931.73]|eukprot:ORY05774.1 hypothetical protein K493DRAFT_333417 [Basidiobolus meristosporus CBS 931.73]
MPGNTAHSLNPNSEVNLRRLLNKCEAQLELTNMKELSDVRNKSKLAANIAYLNRLLEEVRKDNKTTVATINEYSRKITILSNIVDENKLISPVEKGLSQIRLSKQPHESQHARNLENGVERKIVRMAEREMKNDLLELPDRHEAHEEESRTLGDRRSDLFDLNSGMRQRRSPTHEEDPTESAETLLEHHRATQEELTNDLVRMAEILKNNSMSFGDILKRDEKVLDEAHNALTGNLDRLKKESGRLTQFTKRSSKTTWITWGVVALVCLTFIFMFLFIRIFPKRR